MNLAASSGESLAGRGVGPPLSTGVAHSGWFTRVSVRKAESGRLPRRWLSEGVSLTERLLGGFGSARARCRRGAGCHEIKGPGGTAAPGRPGRQSPRPENPKDAGRHRHPVVSQSPPSARLFIPGQRRAPRKQQCRAWRYPVSAQHSVFCCEASFLLLPTKEWGPPVSSPRYFADKRVTRWFPDVRCVMSPYNHRLRC